VTKPIEDMAVLEHAIDHALERARLRRENRAHREHLEAVNEQLRQTVRQLQEDERRRGAFNFNYCRKTTRCIAAISSVAIC
jgi:FixJ family two-component response regulator